MFEIPTGITTAARFARELALLLGPAHGNTPKDSNRADDLAALGYALAYAWQRQRDAVAEAHPRTADELVAEIQRAEAERDVFTAAEWAAQRLRERDLAARGGPILDRMRTFLRAAGRTEEAASHSPTPASIVISPTSAVISTKLTIRTLPTP